MDVLIVGCGYLGGRVAASWQQRGARVFVTTRRPATADEFRARGYVPILCDVTQPATLEALPRVDCLVTAFALDRSAGMSMHDVYVGGMQALVDNVPPPGRWTHVSSSSVYGQTDGSWVDESSPAEPEEPAGKVVRETEIVLQTKMPTAILLRFSGIYGPGRLLRRKTIESAEPIVGDADKWLNVIHVDDGAQAVIAAGDRGVDGRIYNVCDDEPVRRRDFYREMARILGAPEPTFVLPPAEAPIPPHERGNRRLRNHRLREELGVILAYPSFRQGLASSVEEQ